MGIFSSVGSFVNDVFGGTSAASKAQGYNLQSMAVTNKYQKEFAKNAHQWEAQDLLKAGYNPALTTGLGGATAGGAGGGTGPSPTTNGNPIDAVSAIGNLINATSATKADVKLKEAQALAEPINAEANIINAIANKNLSHERGQSEKGSISNIIGAIRDDAVRKAAAKKGKEWKTGFLGLYKYR